MRILSAALLSLAVLSATAVVAPVAAQTPAAGTASPYEGRVNVSDQSAATRDQSLREALAQVVARVSGQGSVAAAAPLISRATQFVQRYGFTQDGASGLQFVASFDQSAVDGQLRALGLPIWGYSVAPAEDLPLTVGGVRSGADYARALSALRAVPGVQSVAVLGADADQLQLSLRAEGGAARIGSALAGNRTLAADGGALKLRLLR
ncbi:MAG: DUF2066 domain-containing protein [Solimonas sp.]